jgi:hypothetical protein
MGEGCLNFFLSALFPLKNNRFFFQPKRKFVIQFSLGLFIYKHQIFGAVG